MRQHRSKPGRANGPVPPKGQDRRRSHAQQHPNPADWPQRLVAATAEVPAASQPSAGAHPLTAPSSRSPPSVSTSRGRRIGVPRTNAVRTAPMVSPGSWGGLIGRGVLRVRGLGRGREGGSRPERRRFDNLRQQPHRGARKDDLRHGAENTSPLPLRPRSSMASSKLTPRPGRARRHDHLVPIQPRHQRLQRLQRRRVPRSKGKSPDTLSSAAAKRNRNSRFMP